MKLMMKSLDTTASAIRDKTETIKEDITYKGRPKTYRKRKLSMTCNLCGKNYTSRMLMKHHMRRYHVVNVLQCTICDKQLTGKKRLEDHMRTHNPQVECNGCNKWFQQKSFKKHQLKCGVRYKKKDNKHMCMFCDLRFSDKRKLRAHSKIHIKCQECDKFCRNEETFERHTTDKEAKIGVKGNSAAQDFLFLPERGDLSCDFLSQSSTIPYPFFGKLLQHYM